MRSEKQQEASRANGLENAVAEHVKRFQLADDVELALVEEWRQPTGGRAVFGPLKPAC